jgi:peroxiredoxin Q/BCP
VILGISFDTVEANRAFAEKFAYPFALLCDPERTTAATYDIDDPEDPGYPLRVSFLIGPDRRVVKVYEVTDAAGHAAEVLADLP